jgi:hypothetical protein
MSAVLAGGRPKIFATVSIVALRVKISAKSLIHFSRLSRFEKRGGCQTPVEASKYPNVAKTGGLLVGYHLYLAKFDGWTLKDD